jgi:hemin uptake protein HemP
MNAPFAQPRPRPTPAPAPATERRQRTNERPEHDARTLTEGGPEARIVLDGMTYVLRITRLGKLILTK